MVISVDFDNTIVDEKYPLIGDLLPYAAEVINYLWGRGHTIIIDSCRTGEAEKQMRGFLRYHKIHFDFINQNSPRMIKRYNSDTRKISCDIRIDDKNLLLYYNAWVNGKTSTQQGLWRMVDSIMYEIEKPLVICIVGESGVGKSLVADYFAYEYGVNLIQSYTDRAKRSSNETGHTFVSERQMDKILAREEDIIAKTTFGTNRYCCLLDDVRKSNCYVIDEVGVKMLWENWGDVFDIYTVRLHRDEDKRLLFAGKERVERDTGRFTLPDSYYDYVIHNITDDKEVLYEQVREFVETFRFKKRFDDYIMLPQEELIYEEEDED